MSSLPDEADEADAADAAETADEADVAEAGDAADAAEEADVVDEADQVGEADEPGAPDGLGQADDPEPEAGPDPGSARPRARAGGGRGQGRGPASPARRAAGPVAALVAVTVLACGLWSVPSVRTVLLQSFTRQQAPFTELYFTAPPSIDGGNVLVPVAVNAHGTGVTSYRLRVTLESGKTKPVGTATVKLKPRDGKAVPVVARVSRKTAQVAGVRVDLVGHGQSLHYSFVAPSPSASPTATPSATSTP